MLRRQMQSRVVLEPVNPLDIGCILGLARYNRRFVERFSSIDSLSFDGFCLSFQKKAKFIWSEACEKSLLELKYRLTSSPIWTYRKGHMVFGFIVMP